MSAPRSAGAPVLAEPVRARSPHVVIFRQAVVDAEQTVRAWALRAAVATTDGRWSAEDEVEPTTEAEYRALDLARLGGATPVLLRATSGLASGATPVPASPRGLWLELSAAMARDPEANAHVAALRGRGVPVVVGDYAAAPEQDALIMAWRATAVVRADDPRLAELARHVHDLEGAVIAAGVATSAARRRAFACGADLVQGPLLQHEADGPLRAAKAGEVQCLEVIRLLSAPDVELEAVVRMVAADPELSIRVLHVVNSSAFALNHTVDSVRHAVILIGPQRLAALAMASLIDARPAAVGQLWSVLSRALTCRSLAGRDAGYTVGLLSAVASQQRIDISSLLATSGVSPELAQALEGHAGPLGQVLTAVLAHEENDPAAVAATGLDPFDVARAHLDAVPEALSIATTLSMDPVG